MNKVKWMLIGLFIVISSGCAYRVADLTLVSTKNIDLNNAVLDISSGQRVKGSDCALSLLGLIPLGVPNIQEAVDSALENGNGNIMVDQVTYVREFYFGVASIFCIEAEGTVLSSAL
jgi:hypothetical protein